MAHCSICTDEELEYDVYARSSRTPLSERVQFAERIEAPTGQRYARQARHEKRSSAQLHNGAHRRRQKRWGL